MSEDVARALDEFSDRERSGRAPRVDAFRETLGEDFKQFVRALEAKRALQKLIEPDEPGTLPREFGRYRLLREVGRGATSNVYEAEDGAGNRLALKLLSARAAAEESVRDRFEREAGALRRINHPNIVTISDFGVIEGQPFLAMSLIDGPSLKRLIAEKRVPAARDAFANMAQVADALHAMHLAGIVHRDVKPGNVLVAPDGRMLLTDFGMARADTDLTLTESGVAVGTPLYMSPEQIRGERSKIDVRSDTYGLGATLYEALTGRPPFDTDSVADLYTRVRTERPRVPSALVNNLPPTCDAVVLKSLEKEPNDRYQTAADLRDDLLALSKGEPARGKPVSKGKRSARLIRRRWPFAAALTLLLAAGAIWLYTRPPATVRVESIPRAELYVNGELVGDTPQILRIEPGAQQLVFRRERFRDHEVSVDLRRGDNPPREFNLIPTSVDDPVALRELFEAADARIRFDPSPSRDPTPPVAAAVYPAGAVRKQDLATLRFEILKPTEFALEGARLTVEVNGKRVHDGPFETNHLVTTTEFPRAALVNLAPGDRVRWGVGAFTADCAVVADDAALDAVLSELDTRLVGQAPEIRAALRAERLLRAGLATAAIREVVDVRKDSFLRRGLLQRALIALNSREVNTSLSLDADRILAHVNDPAYAAWFE